MTEASSQSRQHSASTVISLLGWVGFALIALVTCELGARLDDWFFEGVPVLDNPSYEALFFTDEHGLRRGRPGAKWKRVDLNNLGMRGPDVPPAPRAGCRRWMFLGASETFGEPTVANGDYPARLRLLESQSGCMDILNTAFPAISPKALLKYYTSALSQYAPDTVFVYPSTHFYLAEMPAVDQPKPQQAAQQADQPGVSGLLKKSRFVERLRDSAEVPAVIQKWRVKRWIDVATEGQSPGWLFEEVPTERLDSLTDDLRELVRLIRISGAEPVLMTHAVRVANPPRPQDSQDLFAMRVYVPRASEEVIAGFEYAAADRVRWLGAETGVRVIDVARVMNGRRDRFIDLVHFSADGNDEIAHLIHDEMSRAQDSSADSHAVH